MKDYMRYQERWWSWHALRHPLEWQQARRWRKRRFAGRKSADDRSLVPALAARLVAAAAAREIELCSCPTGPAFEGPQEDCEIHGESRSVLIGQRDIAKVVSERNLLDGLHWMDKATAAEAALADANKRIEEIETGGQQ